MATILRNWPPRPDVDPQLVTDQDVKQFAIAISHLSATRFNMMVSALKATAPAALVLKRQSVRVKERPLLSQLEFSRLLEELDKRPKSHGGLVVRFLAHTGLRIHEARRRVSVTGQQLGRKNQTERGQSHVRSIPRYDQTIATFGRRPPWPAG